MVRIKHFDQIAMCRSAVLAAILLAITVLVARSGGTSAQEGPFVYVPNVGGRDVTVIDIPTDSPLPGTIGLPASPNQAAVRSDQAFVYVANPGNSTVSVIDTATNVAVATINVGDTPFSVAVSPDGTRVYASNLNGGTVSVIDTATNTVVATVNNVASPAGITISPDGTRAYVTNLNSNTVSVIDTITNTVVGTPILVGSIPVLLAVSPDGSRVYVANSVGDSVSVIDTATNMVISTIAVGDTPESVVFAPDGSRAYVGNRASGSVSVIDTVSETVIDTVPVGTNSSGVTISPDGTRVYAANQFDDTVSVIDTATNLVIDTITVGGSPLYPGACGNGNAMLTAGNTFVAKQNSALACTGTGGPVFNGGTMRIAAPTITSALPMTLETQGGTVDTQANTATFSGDITGPGGLTKTGAGTLVLSGINDYGGATTITAGTLVAASDFALPSLTDVTVNNDATLEIDDDVFASANSLAGGGNVVIGSGSSNTNLSLGLFGGNDTTFSGSITGQGNLQLIGGSLTLTGANSLGGDLVIGVAATLTLDGPGASFSTTGIGPFGFLGTAAIGALDVINGGTLLTNELTVFGNMAVSGAGSKATANGITAIAGLDFPTSTRLAIENGGVMDSLGGAFIANLSGTHVPSVTVTGPGSAWNVSGALPNGVSLAIGASDCCGDDLLGVLTVADGGVTTVAGPTQIGTLGVLNLGNGGLAGSIVTPLIDNDGQIVANFTDISTLAADISGNGTLTKAGSGTLFLTGNSTYAGPTTVNGGTLAVNGSIVSPTTVNAGGTLGGDGTIGSLLVASGGIVAPGNSIGTLTVNGNFTLDAGAIFEVEANALGQADKVIVNGTVNLSGAVLRVLAANGNYKPKTEYVIIENDGSDAVQGKFASVTANLAFLTPAVDYQGGTGNDVVLILERIASDFCAVAKTRNQCAVARALDQFPTDNPLFLAVLNQTADGARQAFDALSGEIHATLPGVLADDSRYVREAVLGRLVQASYTNEAGRVAALGSGGPQVASLNIYDEHAMALGYGGKHLAPPEPTAGAAFWTRAYGAWGDFDGNGNAASADRDLGGFISAVDTQIATNWRAGIAAGGAWSNVSVGDRHSSADIESFNLAGYVGGLAGPFALRGGGSWTWSDIDTSRAVIFPGFFERQDSSYDADTGQLFGEIAYPITSGRVAVEPFAGLAYVSIDTDSFRERGGDLSALTGSSDDEDVGYSTLGLRAATVLHASNLAIVPKVSAAWQHAFDDVTPGASLAFASTGIGFGITGVPLAEDSVLLEAGLDFALGPTATLGVSYSGQFADEVADNGVKGRFSWLF